MLSGRRTERGNIFAVLLGAVGISAALSLAVYQLMSGPLASMSRITQKSMAEAQMQAAMRIMILDATNQTGGGDCDTDATVEPRAFRTTAGAKPTNGGVIPQTTGAPVTDSWGTDIGYCVWDQGTTIQDVACGNPPNRLQGTPTVGQGDAVAQTVLAIISAGPDQQFSTTCNNYVDDTTDLITTSGDDIVMRHTYSEAAAIAASSGSLWTLKTGDPNTAMIDKNLEIGTAFSVNKDTALTTASSLSTTGKIIASGGILPGDETDVTVCTAAETGLVRYNQSVQVPTGQTGAITITNHFIVAGVGGANTNGIANRTLATLPDEGETIVVVIFSSIEGVVDTFAGVTVTDNQGNYYNTVLTGPSAAGNGAPIYRVFAAHNIPKPQGSFTVTADMDITDDGSGTWNASIDLGVMSVKGLAAAPLDQTGTTQVLGCCAGNIEQIAVATSAATTQTNELAVALVRGIGTYNNGWYMRGEPTWRVHDHNEANGREITSKIIPTTGVVSHTWKTDQFTGNIDKYAAILTFKGASPTISTNYDTGSLQFCDGTNWLSLTESMTQPTSPWQTGGGGVIYYTAGNVGIGTTAPAAPLHVNGALRIGRHALACNGTTEGAIRYSSGIRSHEYCDGTIWKPIGTTMLRGYFVLGATLYDGNLQGAAGAGYADGFAAANKLCLDDLTANFWRGKDSVLQDGRLDAQHVKAFICHSDGSGNPDNGGCQDPKPLTTYLFARAGSSTSGGNSPFTDRFGRFSSGAVNWGTNNNYFGVTTSHYGLHPIYYYENGGVLSPAMFDTGPLTQYPTCGTNPANSATSWDTTAGNGRRSTTNATTQFRWSNTIAAACTTVGRLICMVHP